MGQLQLAESLEGVGVNSVRLSLGQAFGLERSLGWLALLYFSS